MPTMKTLVMGVAAVGLVLAGASGRGVDAFGPGDVMPRQAAGRVTALVGGTLIDGFGGVPIHNSVVLMSGERITAVGLVGTLAVPAGAQVLSTAGSACLFSTSPRPRDRTRFRMPSSA